jgi:predicted nucleic acid-binding protein
VLADARELRAGHLDLAIGLTAAVNAVLADRWDTDVMITLDRRHFRAVRPLRGEAFRLWPDDLR